jgi:hypothetical protein
MANVSINDLMKYIGKLHAEHDTYIKKLVTNYEETDVMMEVKYLALKLCDRHVEH